MKRRILLVLCLALAACHHPTARLDTPTDFARLGASGDYDVRRASANGVVIAVRTEANQPQASLDFWAEVLDQRLQRDGYTRELARDVIADGGLPGRQLRLSCTKDGRAYRYWLTVFLTDSRLILVEAGGDKDAFESAQPTVERAILSVRFSS